MSPDVLQVYVSIGGLILALVGIPLLFDRVVTMAELFLNHLEQIAVLGDSFGKENRPALDRFCRIALERSPILRQHLAQNRLSYSDSLHAFIPQANEEIERPGP
jgi:hypothetical protein